MRKMRSCNLVKIDGPVEECVNSIVKSHPSFLSWVGKTSRLDSNCRTTFVVIGCKKKHIKIKNEANPFQEDPIEKTGLQSGYMGDYDYIHNGCLEVTFQLVTKTL